MSLVDRFMRHVEHEPNTGCWIWTGGTTGKGHGRFRCGKDKILAHRFSYQEFVGEISNDLDVLHSCDNPWCVNPCHLFLGTHQENMQDMAKKYRGIKSSNGMPYGVKFIDGAKNPYRSRVWANGKLHSLGCYETIDKAHSVSVAFKEAHYQRVGK